MNKFFVLAFVGFLALMVSETEACPGLFGGGGGCCPPPPPPACGCGRKKREVLEQQIKTKESDSCPQKEWKQIMTEVS
uniref:Uncharacterized protein n=1 Tax=Panagrolaimus sp. JU765 TaxID=591449 RepID=A0AC34RLY4_9BILA